MDEKQWKKDGLYKKLLLNPNDVNKYTEEELWDKFKKDMAVADKMFDKLTELFGVKEYLKERGDPGSMIIRGQQEQEEEDADKSS